MTMGTDSTQPEDRQVIFVGDRGAALNAAARALAGDIFAQVKRGVSPFAAVMAVTGLGAIVVSPVSLVLIVVSAVSLGALGPIERYFARSLREKSREELVDILSKTLELGTPLTAFSPAAANSSFKFGVGHSPRSGSIYVKHPVLPQTYIAPEEFSRTVSREKEAAFRQLASALGAKELRLVTATVHTKKGFFGGTVPVPQAAAEVGVKVSFDSKGQFVKQVYSKFGRPRSAPRVPPDLMPWVEMDSEMRTMARDRTEGHLLENRITLVFKEGMGVGGEVAAKVAGRGLTAGGSYSALSHSVWHFEAEYWPLD